VPAIALLLAALTLPVEGMLRSETRPAFASLATVTIAGVPEERAAAAFDAAFAALARVDWSMNEWRPGTPLADLNAAAGGRWILLPADLCQALAFAKAAATRTEGRFDPTWAALRDLWRFDGERPAPPSDAALAARCPLVDHRALLLRPAPGGCEGRLSRAGMQVGLGGLAKGLALDAAARALRALDVHDFLLQAGGDLYGGGTRGGVPWRVAVRDPRGGPVDPLPGYEVELRDAAFSTTGDYEHAFVAGGRRYHHVIDPRTCRPGEASRAVSVLAPTAAEAEVLGKSLFLSGGEAALAEAARAGARAIVVDADGTIRASPGLLPGPRR
jgi:thiamine biosynthesis lipoprotein